MWMLTKDHFRRNWKQFVLLILLFIIFLYLNEGSASDGKLDWVQYIVYVLLVLGTASHSSADTLKNLKMWRTLPLHESTLANLSWGMQVLIPPVLFFLVALLVELVTGRFGKAVSNSLIWPFVFLLLALLGSGLYAFVSTSHRREYARANATPRAQRTIGFWLSHNLKLASLLACAAVPTLMVLYLAPPRWSDLGLRQYTGLALAVALTYQSYRMRFWLLQPLARKDDAPQTSPRPDCAPRHRETSLTALARELGNTAVETALALLLIIGCGYLILFCMTWSGLVANSGGRDSVLGLIAGICAMVSFRLVYQELNRISMLGAVRALPLTTNQSLALLMSYPYTVSLAALPCMALSMLLNGNSQIPALLLAGTLLSAGLCPFGMFILGRFGPSGLRPIAMVGILLIAPATVFIMNSALGLPQGEWSLPVLCVGVALAALLGLAGYYGLRRLIENSSTLYKRAPEHALFGQGLGR